MARIHITLVGGQAAPVYNGIIVTNPDKVVFIYSVDSKGQMEMVKSMLNIPVDDQQPLDAINPEAILKRAETLYNKYQNDQITLNISGGLKSWTHLFGVYFSQKKNAEIVYFDQNNILWNYTDMSQRSDFNFDMHTQLKLYGNSIENNFTDFNAYTEADMQVLKKIESLRKGQFIEEFNKLLTILDKKNANKLKNDQSGIFVTGKGSFVDWMKDKNGGNARVKIVIKGKYKEQDVTLESPHAIDLAFKSGWFEYKVAKMLSTWSKAKEIYLNCRFKSKKNVDKNEVDIIVNTGQKLLFVECKTCINNNTDIDKFRTVVKGYGGTASKGIFITQSKMKEIEIEKCEQAGLLSFSIDEVSGGTMGAEQALFALLDSSIFNINTK